MGRRHERAREREKTRLGQSISEITAMIQSQDREFAERWPHTFNTYRDTPFISVAQATDQNFEDLRRWMEIRDWLFEHVGALGTDWDERRDYIGIADPNAAFEFKMRWI